MNNKFFITGLPRSRTAWFSAFMTASGYPCLHEGLNGCKSIAEYKQKIKHKSDSNTGFIFVDAPIDRPTLVIHREDRHDGLFDNVDLNKIKGLHVEFSDIHERIEEIFTYLTGDQIDWVIYNTFKNLNVTTMLEMDVESAKVLLNEAS